MSELMTKIERIEESCEHIKERIARIDTTLAVNTESLKEHMRRTEANERAIEIVMNDALPPIKATMEKIHFTIKAIPWVVGVVAAIVTMLLKSGISIF